MRASRLPPKRASSPKNPREVSPWQLLQCLPAFFIGYSNLQAVLLLEPVKVSRKMWRRRSHGASGALCAEVQGPRFATQPQAPRGDVDEGMPSGRGLNFIGGGLHLRTPFLSRSSESDLRGHGEYKINRLEGWKNDVAPQTMHRVPEKKGSRGKTTGAGKKLRTEKNGGMGKKNDHGPKSGPEARKSRSGVLKSGHVVVFPDLVSLFEQWKVHKKCSGRSQKTG